MNNKHPSLPRSFYLAGWALLSASLLFSSAAQAQSWYQIEVILFKHNQAAGEQQTDSDGNTVYPEDSELWPTELDLQWRQPLIELDSVQKKEPTSAVPRPFERLPRDLLQMANEAYALRVRPQYELLWHQAWKAPLLNEESSPWIKVQAGEQINDRWPLEGAIRIHLSRYLHLSTDLWFIEPADQLQPGQPATEQIASDQIADEQQGSTPDTLPESSPTPSPTIKATESRDQGFDLFQWSAVPAKPENIRWSCNFVREFWPEDDQLLPADYYEEPAPTDWYFPFGCSLPRDMPKENLPLWVSAVPETLDRETEFRQRYPELFSPDTFFQPGVDLANSTTLAAAPIENRSNIESNSENTTNSRTREREGRRGIKSELSSSAEKMRRPIKRITQIKSRRRMRSGELHYVDHPDIGVLIQINRVDKPQLVEEENPDALSSPGVE